MTKKELNIKVMINDDETKMAIGIHKIGYNSYNLSHQLEILGILENLTNLQKDKIKTLMKADRKN